MIGLYLAVGSSNHLPPWGGAELLLGTNPLAVAIPAQEEPPIVLTWRRRSRPWQVGSRRSGEDAAGWMIDRKGRTLTDPKRADEGFLLPIGGYKGYGLSLIIGLLAGTLNRAALGRDVVDFVKESARATNTGHAIVAMGRGLRARGGVQAQRRRGGAHAPQAERLPGVERIRLPGEQSQATERARGTDGIPMPKPLRDSLDALAAELKIAPLP
ncbi:MAG: Ldh family oxidoreductase [Xanthobacteraceae bacterium]|nr:Ldh family oxidoreductase [Xanthobacteraceae bacterium]